MQYQWIKGERLGEIEVLDKTDEEWVYFASGRRINPTLMNEYMLPINEYDKPMSIPGQVSTASYSFQSEDDDKTIRDAEGNVYTPPSPILENQRQVNRHVHQQEQPKKKEINPIQLLLNQAAKDEIEVSVDIKIKLPKKAVYALISESFDTDIDKQIKEMVSEDINFEKMKQVILESVDNTIKNYYKSK
jgi:hypothetical protein